MLSQRYKSVVRLFVLSMLVNAFRAHPARFDTHRLCDADARDLGVFDHVSIGFSELGIVSESEETRAFGILLRELHPLWGVGTHGRPKLSKDFAQQMMCDVHQSVRPLGTYSLPLSLSLSRSRSRTRGKARAYITLSHSLSKESTRPFLKAKRVSPGLPRVKENEERYTNISSRDAGGGAAALRRRGAADGLVLSAAARAALLRNGQHGTHSRGPRANRRCSPFAHVTLFSLSRKIQLSLKNNGTFHL